MYSYNSGEVVVDDAIQIVHRSGPGDTADEFDLQIDASLIGRRLRNGLASRATTGGSPALSYPVRISIASRTAVVDRND